MHRLTASRVWLSAHCTAFLNDFAVWDETSGPAAQTGNAIHRAIELEGTTGDANLTSLAVEFALAPYQIKKLRASYAHWVNWASNQDRSRWEHETGFALDPWAANARPLQMKGARDYSGATEDDVCGSADIIETGDALAVMDVKTGRWLDDPAESEQLLTLALAAKLAHGRRGPVKAALLKVNEEGVTPLWTEYDEFRLEEHRLSLAERLDEARGNPMPNPGEWCRRCPCSSTCRVSTTKESNSAYT